MLALLMPVSLSAQNTAAADGAVLSPTGMVTVDGELTTRSSALLGKETISTGPDSGAHITSTGTNTVLAADTVASFSRDSIQLKSGAVKITTSNGTFAEVDKMKFGPANPAVLTRFDVQKSGCEIIVIARSGSVSMPDGKILEQGHSYSHSDKACEGDTQVVQSHHIPAAVWILGGAAAAGTAAGVALLETGSKTPVSPSK
jgi:hypothetical protein